MRLERTTPTDVASVEREAGSDQIELATSDGAIVIDPDTARWLMVAALPAVLAPPRLHSGGKAASVPGGQAHDEQGGQQP